MYLLYSLKMQGWMSHGAWQSDQTRAVQFDKSTAFSLALGTNSSMRSLILIPVSVEDLALVLPRVPE